ncbi:MAG: exodeoxyribonuclease VII small subunit [Caldilineaceae bacterium]|nr:exodeoxyribonuclease VII small subunit [Caldilineaceae bacterium]
MMTEATTDAPTPLSYEEAFAQLEQILATLEDGDLPLEQSLMLYEQGAELAQLCTRLLDQAELRVRQWQPGDETTPLDNWQEG